MDIVSLVMVIMKIHYLIIHYNDNDYCQYYCDYLLLLLLVGLSIYIYSFFFSLSFLNGLPSLFGKVE